MKSSDSPSREELKKAHAAESRAISQKIAEGYDFKEEMASGVFNSVFGSSMQKSSLEMNKERLKSESKRRFHSSSPSP